MLAAGAPHPRPPQQARPLPRLARAELLAPPRREARPRAVARPPRARSCVARRGATLLACTTGVLDARS